jgi:glycosyltransferase involved in cell wall biosynthesis
MQGTSIPARAVPRRASLSVAIATYNGERFLAKQLHSILSQLGAGDEVVVVDDASTDHTLEVIASCGDGRVRVLRNERNAGVFEAFERALGATQGDIVFLSDQDDIWLPGKVEEVVARFERDTAVLLVLSDAEVIDEQGTVTARSFMASRGGFKGGFAATLVRNRYLGCTMAMRRALLDSVLPIPPDVPMHDMWFGSLAVLQGRVDYIDRPLVQYRRHGGNVSPARRQSVGQMLRWRWSLLRNVASRRRTLRDRAAAGPVA